MTWSYRKTWALSQVERAELKSIVDEAGDPPSWFPGASSATRALRRPLDEGPALAVREAMALDGHVRSIDRTLRAALHEFFPDELWSLLHALEVAETGTPRGRVDALKHGELEYLSHADEAVAAWRDMRRLRERTLTMITKRGLRGWDDPHRRQYLNSAPIESSHRDALMSVEKALLSHAAHRVAIWLISVKRLRQLHRSRRGVALRREVVSLLKSAGLGYERITALATASYWLRPPCPSLTRARLLVLVKADLRASRRAAAVWSAAVER